MKGNHFLKIYSPSARRSLMSLPTLIIERKVLFCCASFFFFFIFSFLFCLSTPQPMTQSPFYYFHFGFLKHLLVFRTERGSENAKIQLTSFTRANCVSKLFWPPLDCCSLLLECWKRLFNCSFSLLCCAPLQKLARLLPQTLRRRWTAPHGKLGNCC